VSNQPVRLLLLFGGRSEEHDVSVASAIAMLRALRDTEIEVMPVGISREGRWHLGPGALRMLGQSALFSAGEDIRALAAPETTPRTIVEALGTADVVFPLLHGPFGEDGTVQGMLELADVPYAGAGVLASALSMDKLAMKAAFRAAGLPVAPYAGLLRSQWRQDAEAVLRALEEQLEYPMFVKPANLGSSVGISKARDRRELAAALDLAALYDRRLVIEQGLDARELECGVLGNDEPQASVVGEVLPGAEFYDYEAKYVGETARAQIPADIPPDISQQMRTYAVRAFQEVDGAGMARVDFFLVGSDIYLNEINTIPGFTPISQFPMLWQASGIDYPELVRTLIALAMERHGERRQSAGREVL